MNKQGLLSGIDWYLIACTLILIIFSLTTLFSINLDIFRNQFFFVIIGIAVFFFFSQTNYKFLQYFSLSVYIVSLVLLFLLLIIGIESRGAARWLQFFGFGIQFSEILKPFLVLTFASFLTGREKNFKTFLMAIGLLLPLAFLLYKQPDLGNAIIYGATVLFTMFFYGFPWWWFAAIFATIAGLFPFLWRFLHVYQQQRLLTFFHLTSDPLGISYNAVQSIIAVGSGLVWGKGLGQGTQSTLRFLPERHTDFIFATLSEELGFIGAATVIIVFCVLLYRIFVILSETDDTFSRTFMIGAFSIFLIQCIMNVGMNIGLLPIVGVTLPFVSYGGSSLIANAIFLGLISAMARENRKKHVMEIT